MKIKRILMAVALLFLVLAPVYNAQTTAARAQAKKSVQVFFWRDRESSVKNPYGISAVTRSVSARSPAREALEALLKGPTVEEQKQGYLTMYVEEFSISLLRIKDGTARVSFVASRNWPGWAGDLSPGRFREAVTRTLKQFPNVRRVIISINGDTKFDSMGG